MIPSTPFFLFHLHCSDIYSNIIKSPTSYEQKTTSTHSTNPCNNDLFLYLFLSFPPHRPSSQLSTALSPFPRSLNLPSISLSPENNTISFSKLRRNDNLYVHVPSLTNDLPIIEFFLWVPIERVSVLCVFIYSHLFIISCDRLIFTFLGCSLDRFILLYILVFIVMVISIFVCMKISIPLCGTMYLFATYLPIYHHR